VATIAMISSVQNGMVNHHRRNQRFFCLGKSNMKWADTFANPRRRATRELPRGLSLPGEPRGGKSSQFSVLRLELHDY
jgi:hypothetical protein